MRRRNVKNAHERLYKHVGLLIENPYDCLNNLDNIFPKKQPIHVEIGMGKGKFIIELAKRNPDINYIGLEKFESVILQACTKLEEETPSNLRLMCCDATDLLKIFPKESVDKIYLNFSDPWPKNRHEKRRLTSSSFLKLYEEITKKETVIEFKTDNRGLFEYSLKSFNENKYIFDELSLNLHEDKEDIVTTEYEDRFSAKGNPIYYVRVKK